MTTRSLYAYARRRGHLVFSAKLNRVASVSVQLPDGQCGIGVDRRGMTDAVEKSLLGHELGHCETGSFYSRYTKVDCIARHENRADKWAVEKLIPEDALDAAVAAGHTDLWDLAEYFGVTEALMKKAVCWYTHGNMAAELYF